MSDLVRFSLEGSVARLHFDDGKANVVSPTSLPALNAALDRAEKEAGAVVLLGRDGRFSGGFDLRRCRPAPIPHGVSSPAAHCWRRGSPPRRCRS